MKASQKNVGAPTAAQLTVKLRALRRLLLPLLSGSRAQRKAKVNTLLRGGYSAVATAVGDAIARDCDQPVVLGTTVTSTKRTKAVVSTPYADDVGVIAAWMRDRPIRYAHLIEQVEAEYLKTNNLTLPERLS